MQNVKTKDGKNLKVLSVTGIKDTLGSNVTWHFLCIDPKNEYALVKLTDEDVVECGR